MLHFLGVISFGGALPDAAAVAHAGQRLGGEGFGPMKSWRGPGCVLVCRRRPLRDTDSAARDPVLARDGELVLVGSGRIDRRDELIRALARDPHAVWTDAALMMAGFERWGAAGADRLHGAFSFAVWDWRAQRLILTRDSFGMVPLFYHHGDGFVAFASSPAALLALEGVSRDLNPAMIGEYLAGRMMDPTATLYRAIQRVPRAGNVTIDPAGKRTEIYWRPRRGPILRLADDQAYVEATREVLADVLCGHLRSTAPIGLMLSGGFDSGALAATLARLAPDREILGFTTVPVAGAKAYDRGAGREWELVELLARRYPNLRIEAVAEKAVTPIDDTWRDHFAATGVPLPSVGLVARRLALAQAAHRRGVGTLLNGDGGNRTLTGEGEDAFHYLLLSGRWRALLREVVGTARYQNRSIGTVIWQDVLREIVPRAALGAWRRWRGCATSPVHDRSFLRPDFAIAHGVQDRWEQAPHNQDRLDLVRARDFEPICLGMAPDSADCFHVAFHRLGMESVAPLRDRRMVDFFLSLPPDQFRRDGVPRFLARRVLADRLPPEILAQTGYFEPFADVGEWLVPWWERVRQRLADQRPAELAAAAIDLPKLRACLDAGPDGLPTGGPREQRVLWNLIRSLHLNEFIRWHQKLND